MLVEKLSRQAKVSEDWLWHLARTASVRYKLYEIPKRTGGTRLIEHPSRDLKSVQRWLTHEVVGQLPVHQNATAYKKGTSIQQNASLHLGSRYTVRYDFRSFFPSFSDIRIRRFLQEITESGAVDLDSRDIDFFTDCVTRKGRLTIGAPSSPALSNAMMFQFDSRMTDMCGKSGLRYTRYADDIFVSSKLPDQLNDIGEYIASARKGISYLSLRLNREKTVHLSKKSSRKITGLVITTDNKVSIGRDRKREIKSLVHRFILLSLLPDEIGRLKGLIAFAHDAEPEFVDRLKTKYGVHNIDRLMGS